MAARERVFRNAQSLALATGDRLKVATGVAATLFELLTPHEACAQTSGDQAGSSVSLGARGGFSTSRAQSVVPEKTTEQEFAYTFAAGMASDYIYRGVTLSAHQPAVGAAFKARFGSFYTGSTITSVKLPSDPAVELSYSSGFRPSLSGFDLDIGVTYSLYPGEVSGIDTDYFELVGRVDRKLTEKISVAAGFAYSPNVSNTGAWSKYAAAGISIELPNPGLLPDVTASFTTSAGNARLRASSDPNLAKSTHVPGPGDAGAEGSRHSDPTHWRRYTAGAEGPLRRSGSRAFRRFRGSDLAGGITIRCDNWRQLSPRGPLVAVRGCTGRLISRTIPFVQTSGQGVHRDL
jgi:uncharacterized protein (TIGR02001 family)